MKPLTLSESLRTVVELQEEIGRSEESRYDHRLHGVLLVAQGLTCPEVARLLGDAPRAVEYWVHRFEKDGLAELVEGEHPGRPRRLNAQQWEGVNRVVRQPPQAAGFSGSIGDGKTLSAWIEREYGVIMGVRQCQRTFRQLGFRLRKPRPKIASSDPQRQQEHKKNSRN